MDVSAGTARPIVRYGAAVLHRPCARVTSFDAELEALLGDMFASMYAASGVGLAANQIGVGLRAFVYDCPDASGDNQDGHVINPVLTTIGAIAAPVTDSEACLSVPGQQAEVSRAAVATVTGTDVRGCPVTVTGTGLLARCLQHETDHLGGIVYVDLLSADERSAILAAAGLPGRHRRGGLDRSRLGRRPAGQDRLSS